MRYVCIILTLLTVAGCGFTRTAVDKSLHNLTNPLNTLQEQSASLGGSMQLETQLRNLFDQQDVSTGEYTYPMADYTAQRTKKIFGQYIQATDTDLTAGYHTGDDIEVADPTALAPVYALTTAKVIKKETVSGYGVVILEFIDGITTYHALYSYLDLNSVPAQVGETVEPGATLGRLSDDGVNATTANQRKHLYFSIYPYTGTELFSENTAKNDYLNLWINPADWLREHQAVSPQIGSATS